ncbi:hypothetical protein O181_039463 [Austropuccinia psidii MF-1]|uniref:Chromo domain-containing protein n=1 Tax=Austropuccinia psidii MF-1 TaxID=1389203 RepID=A0A9Q3HC02_9BASI|nr:hypothetical protein [Austropuccinia psidii MF-1]
MLHRACDTAARCIAKAKEYNKQRWDKPHMEHNFKEGDQVLVSTLNFNNLKEPKEIRDSFVGPFTIIKLIGRKCSGVPLQEEESHFTRNSGGGDLPVPVRKIINAGKIRLNGKEQRQYLVQFKKQTEDKEKWLAEDAIPDGSLKLRGLIASSRTEQSHQL